MAEHDSIQEYGYEALAGSTENQNRLKAARDTLTTALETARESSAEVCERAETYIRKSPLEAVGYAAGIGAILGLIIGALMGRREHERKFVSRVCFRVRRHDWNSRLPSPGIVQRSRKNTLAQTQRDCVPNSGSLSGDTFATDDFCVGNGSLSYPLRRASSIHSCSVRNVVALSCRIVSDAPPCCHSQWLPRSQMKTHRWSDIPPPRSCGHFRMLYGGALLASAAFRLLTVLTARPS